MDTDPNLNCTLEHLTTPTELAPSHEEDMEVLLNVPLQPPCLQSPHEVVSKPELITTLTDSTKPDKNCVDSTIEVDNTAKDLTESLNNRNKTPPMQGAEPNSEYEGEEMIPVSSKVSLRVQSPDSPPGAGNTRYFFDSPEGSDKVEDEEDEYRSIEASCARTIGRYNLRPMPSTRWGKLLQQKRMTGASNKNKHPANPNKKRRQKGLAAEGMEHKKDKAEEKGAVQDNALTSNDEEVIVVDCETDNCLISHSQLFRLNNLNSQNQDDNAAHHAILDPGTAQKQVLADIWNDSHPHTYTINGHMPIPSQEVQDEMSLVSVDQESNKSATDTIAVVFNGRRIDDIDKGLLMEAEEPVNVSLTESSVEDLVIAVPSSIDESPLLSSQGESPEIPFQGHQMSLQEAPSQSHDFVSNQDQSHLMHDTNHAMPSHNIPDQDCSLDVVSSQDLVIDSDPSPDLDPTQTDCSHNVIHDNHSQDMFPVTEQSEGILLSSPEYSPIQDPPLTLDNLSLALHQGMSPPPHQSPTLHRSSPTHTNHLSLSHDLSSSPLNVSKAPWNIALPRSRSSSPDPLAVPPPSQTFREIFTFSMPLQRMEHIKSYLVHHYLKK